MNATHEHPVKAIWLRRLSKITSYSTLFLIFVGSLVTSTGSGLSVPDWPLSYGTLTPPMVGGIRFEHSHRVVAALIGFLMLCLTIVLARIEQRKWVRNLGFFALGAVILQGVLGGITVLFLLPKPVSITHGILAQTFFVLTVIIAYSQSLERKERLRKQTFLENETIIRMLSAIFVLVFIQLILGALMRHTHSGLAIPDFPKTGGMWWPTFDAKMLAAINADRFFMNLDPARLGQVVIHFTHRLWAGCIFVGIIFLTVTTLKAGKNNSRAYFAIMALDILVVVQMALGMMTVLSQKSVLITSLHVVNGAAILGWVSLTLLRLAPVSWSQFRHIFFRQNLNENFF